MKTGILNSIENEIEREIKKGLILKCISKIKKKNIRYFKCENCKYLWRTKKSIM